MLIITFFHVSGHSNQVFTASPVSKTVLPRSLTTSSLVKTEDSRSPCLTWLLCGLGLCGIHTSSLKSPSSASPRCPSHLAGPILSSSFSSCSPRQWEPQRRMSSASVPHPPRLIRPWRTEQQSCSLNPLSISHSLHRQWHCLSLDLYFFSPGSLHQLCTSSHPLCCYQQKLLTINLIISLPYVNSLSGTHSTCRVKI